MTQARGRAAVVLAAALGCGGAPRAPEASRPVPNAMLPDVRLAKDRPPVVLVSREGDPAAAVAVAVATAALEVDDDAEPAVALASLVETRVAARGLHVVVTPSWDGFRAAVLASTEGEARAASEALRLALGAPVREEDLAGARRKLAALGARPLRDPALARWARCTGSPYALPSRAGRAGEDLAVDKLESWRAAAHGLGRIAFSVAGSRGTGEAVAADVAQGPAWRAGAPIPAAAAAQAIDVDAYETAAETPWTAPVVHATLDARTSSEAVWIAEALGDARGPLSARLAGLDVPFRVREIVGAAHPQGGCVGVVLEPSSPYADSDRTDRAPAELAARAAAVVALLHVEARAAAGSGAPSDGRALARRAGDAREAAERAAWWALADGAPARAPRASVAMGLPTRRGSAEGALDEARAALGAAVPKAMAAWQRSVVESRSRVEAGQGEAWVLFASACGTESEGDVDAGLSALVAVAAADVAQASSRDVKVEPWIAADGAGVVAHGPALAGEASAAHARRLADVVARAFAAEPLAAASVARARAELGRREAPALSVLASALSPTRPSWVVPWGLAEITSRASDAAVAARAQALRAGPLRLAMLANVNAAQVDAALRAADRWVDRRGDARACRPAQAGSPPRPGTYSVEPRAGAAPEAWLAFPFPAADEVAKSAAASFAIALGGDGGLLERALGGGLARSWSASISGWPRAPALVVRVSSTQASLDAAVLQVRALVDRLHKGGLAPADQGRAAPAAQRAELAGSLDPRARLIAAWRGEPWSPPRASTADELRAFADKHLGEDALVVVAARHGRQPARLRGDGTASP